MSEEFNYGDLVETQDGYFGLVEDAATIPEHIGPENITVAPHQVVLVFLCNGLRIQTEAHLLTPKCICIGGAHANFAELLNAKMKVTLGSLET